MNKHAMHTSDLEQMNQFYGLFREIAFQYICFNSIQNVLLTESFRYHVFEEFSRYS